MLNQLLNTLNLEGKDIKQRTMQPPKHTRIYHLGEIKQKGLQKKRMGEGLACKHILDKLSPEQDQEGSSRNVIDLSLRGHSDINEVDIFTSADRKHVVRRR